MIQHSSWNKTAVYKCNEGYALSPPDDNKMQCVENGIWKGTFGTCYPGKTLFYTWFNVGVFHDL